jgi:hypothetical protein
MTPDPFLRTLAPLLRGLDNKLRAWLGAGRRFPLTAVQRAEAEGLADDLTRQAAALDVDRPLLVVMLMGGTGVGKSTLFNALAGRAVAAASVQRPTTRDPVVYFHQAIPPDKLDPALRLCRLVQHDRDALSQKVIVDTPDLDSNDLTNRDKLVDLLPVSDVILYVGSQEKYHDRLGWELFKEQRRRRAFAFVLNKWDRCVQDGAVGLRPDEDLLADLKQEGFANPKLFRTAAQAWIEAEEARRPAVVPSGEQFADLRDWLELGLTRLEIEAVKARGVGQLLDQLERVVAGAAPPDLAAEADKVKSAWQDTLTAESDAQAEVLVNALDPYQTEIEQHFALRGQRRFTGLMAGYLRLTTKLRFAGGVLRGRLPLPPVGPKTTDDADWDVTAFAYDCAKAAGERVLDQRTTALVNKLLVEADGKGFPLNLLTDPARSAGTADWPDKRTRALTESLAEVEREVTRPTGWRKLVRGGLTLLANVLPGLILVASIVIILWIYIYDQVLPSLAHMLLPIYATLGTLVVLHLLISVLLPVRWPVIKGDFRRRLEGKLGDELRRAFLPIPDEVAADLMTERKQSAELVKETAEVSAWLTEREQAARVADLYGEKTV